MTTSETKIVDGIVNAAGADVSFASQCLTDQFQVTNSGGVTPPVICGVNTGEHSNSFLLLFKFKYHITVKSR